MKKKNLNAKAPRTQGNTKKNKLVRKSVPVWNRVNYASPGDIADIYSGVA